MRARGPGRYPGRMKFLPFLLRHLRASRFRTLTTVAAVAACVFLLCTLEAVLDAVDWGLRSASARRLVTQHAVGVAYLLPLSYQPRIAALPGVTAVSVASWFGGSLVAKRQEREAAEPSRGPDFTRFFPNMAVDGGFFPMHPEYALPPPVAEAYRAERRGCVIGPGLARRYGWKPGDRFFLESFIPYYRRREGPFEFVVSGVYEVDQARHPGTSEGMMFFHFEYLREATGDRIGAWTYRVGLADPDRAAALSREIDALFENSDAQTRTGTESAYRAGLVSLSGNLALLLRSIGLSVAFTILLVTANTMSMAVRERRKEIGLLKCLGFSSGQVMGMVLAEALILAGAGGGLGLMLGSAAMGVLPELPLLGDVLRQYPHFGLSPSVAAVGLGAAVLLGLGAGVVPAAVAYRARIVDTLRGV
jgi:putative ABC transport system permease protein